MKEVSVIKTTQLKVRIFNKENDLALPIQTRVLDIISEFGELSKEILKSSAYGTKPVIVSKELTSEFGDVLYSVISLANSLDIDLEECLMSVLDKYKSRIKFKQIVKY